MAARDPWRFLNAANDRFWNLQMYRADGSDTEVALNPAELATAQTDPTVLNAGNVDLHSLLLAPAESGGHDRRLLPVRGQTLICTTTRPRGSRHGIRATTTTPAART